MARIEVDSAGFVKFIESIKLGGLVTDTKINADAEKGIITAKGIDDYGVIIFKVGMKDGATITESGEIPLPDLEEILALIRRLDQKIVIEYNNNNLVLSSGTKKISLLVDKDLLIKSYQKFADSIDITDTDVVLKNKSGESTNRNYSDIQYMRVVSTSLKEIVKDAQAIKVNNYTFNKPEADKLKVAITRYNDSIVQDMPISLLKGEDVFIGKEAFFNWGLSEVFNILDNEVDIAVYSKFAMIVKFNHNLYIICEQQNDGNN